MQPQDAEDEAFVRSQVQRFLQPDSGVSALDLCGNKQGTALALQVLKHLLLAARSRASNQEAAGVELEQISLLKKQARAHCHRPLDDVKAQYCRFHVTLRFAEGLQSCNQVHKLEI